MGVVANVTERVVNQATPMVIARYTPQAAGLFSVMLYLRVMQAVGVLFTTLDWSDTAAQQMVLTGDAYEEGVYTIRPVTVRAAMGTDLTLTVETDVINAVAVSAAIKAQ